MRIDASPAIIDRCTELEILIETKFHYMAVIEEQERGALHFHIAVRGRQCYALLRSIWQRVVGLGADGQQMGQANVRDPHAFVLA
jgi:hypothetical protein